MNETIKVTLIVAIYNGEKYLADCVRSIINQTHKNIEIILVDDGSSDNSFQICKEFSKADSRVISLHQDNSGCSSARNNGLSVATGDYICIVDQDDLIVANYVDYLLSVALNNNVEIVTTYKVKKFINQIDYNQQTKLTKVKICSGIYAAKEMLSYGLLICPWNKIVKKELMEKNNIKFNVKYFCGEGFAYSVECFANADRVAITYDDIYLYRVDNPNSGTSSFSKTKLFSSINSIDYMYEKTKDKHIKKVYFNYAKWHSYCDFLVIMMASNSKKSDIDSYKLMRKECRKKAFSALFIKTKFSSKVLSFMYFFAPVITAKLISKKANKATGNKFEK